VMRRSYPTKSTPYGPGSGVLLAPPGPFLYDTLILQHGTCFVKKKLVKC
jgi:hypothetical protein